MADKNRSAGCLMLKTFRLLLLLVVAMLLGSGPAAFAVTPIDVVVEDRAGVLDRDTLVPATTAIEFHKHTKVAVYTYNGNVADNKMRGFSGSPGPNTLTGSAPTARNGPTVALSSPSIL